MLSVRCRDFGVVLVRGIFASVSHRMSSVITIIIIAGNAYIVKRLNVNNLLTFTCE
jgi:hypothetical protein